MIRLACLLVLLCCLVAHAQGRYDILIVVDRSQPDHTQKERALRSELETLRAGAGLSAGQLPIDTYDVSKPAHRKYTEKLGIDLTRLPFIGACEVDAVKRFPRKVLTGGPAIDARVKSTFQFAASKLTASRGGIAGGQGVGPYRLGASYKSFKLGTPSRTIPSMHSEKTKTHVFDDLGLGFFVKDDRLNGITVLSDRWATADGLRIGSRRTEVEARMGRPQVLRPNEVVYPERGLGFKYDESGIVRFITVTETEKTDTLKGDRTIVAGRRIGGLNLGVKFADVVAAWGQPNQTAPLPSPPGRLVCLFEKQGIIVVQFNGAVEAITAFSGEYGTPENLRVGSTRQDVQRVYGNKPTLAGGIEAYKDKGIGFTYEADKVTEITVLTK